MSSDSDTTPDAAHPRFSEKHPGFSEKPELKETVLRVGLVQLAVTVDKAKNIAAAVQAINSCVAKGCQLVSLPECFNSPYGTNFFPEYAEEIPTGQTSVALSTAAERNRVYVVGGSFPERCGDKIYNTCTVWDNTGKLIAVHRKMHLFDIDIPGKMTFKESDVLSPGNNITMFDCRGFKIGVGICYDIRFPETAHIMAKKGCSMLIYPAAFNMTTGPKHWELLGRSRANDEQLFVALVSPARDLTASYVAWGHTAVIDPWGAVIQELKDLPGVIIADLDMDVVNEVRSNIPIRDQRRTDVYDTVTYIKPK